MIESGDLKWSRIWFRTFDQSELKKIHLLASVVSFDAESKQDPLENQAFCEMELNLSHFSVFFAFTCMADSAFPKCDSLTFDLLM
jgi:hypothetical protein